MPEESDECCIRAGKMDRKFMDARKEVGVIRGHRVRCRVEGRWGRERKGVCLPGA